VLSSNDIENLSSIEQFDKFLRKEKIKYIEISVFENHPKWLYDWAQEQEYAAQVYYIDKQPALIIYQRSYL